ncbi:hypothetical protein IL38_20520 [Actinopolyspora erythraea]|uniref:Uncharacterized protein n=1 Tax=Actinopolyspora erythraea TaxID=414996 RepID=A0ABR4WZM6_9ACTN|nr:hypothetical protein [Actinopolyspora erythraea]KGI79849.1 hypothetical protein IL38_20520 [Actinopolyspora erythraea]
MTAELISWAPAGWHLVRLGLAVLCGILVTALPATILLVRARRRQQRLRRQLARLSTSTALLAGSARNGQPRRVGAGADPDEDVQRCDSPAAGSEPEPERKKDTRGPDERPTGVDEPTEPDALAAAAAPERSTGAERPEHRGGSDGESYFGSEESAERFRREYLQPMDDSKQRLEELRMRLTGELRMEENEHSGNGRQPGA